MFSFCGDGSVGATVRTHDTPADKSDSHLLLFRIVLAPLSAAICEVRHVSQKRLLMSCARSLPPEFSVVLACLDTISHIMGVTTRSPFVSTTACA